MFTYRWIVKDFALRITLGHKNTKVKRSKRLAQTSALQPKNQPKKSCEGTVMRSSRLRNMVQTSRNQDVEQIRIEVDLTGNDEEEEYHGAKNKFQIRKQCRKE